MYQITCPNCGKVFSVDEATYASIANQIKNNEFQTEVKRRVEEMARQHEAEEKAHLANKDTEIVTLKAAIDQKDNEIRIALLKEQQKIQDVLQSKEAEIAQLRNKAELERAGAELKAKNIKEEYENRLRVAQEQIDYYKDLKARMSTKMVGETLEAHCSNVFNGEMRPMFPNAYFEKDNDASGGSKGDFIFRDKEDGTEYISIMFEMKNEMDETATKHKNEDFFKKLDADRNAKGCEYAVLVSLLEPDSELYNTGIVDVSHRYPKMFVIRPQFFRPLIMLLTNAAKKNVAIKKELALVKSQNIDITHFEDKLTAFRDDFSNHYSRATGKVQDAIKNINETIKKLEAVKKSFELSEKYLRLANEDVDEITIKKLTKDNPTMKARFDALKRSAKEVEAEGAGE